MRHREIDIAAVRDGLEKLRLSMWSEDDGIKDLLVNAITRLDISELDALTIDDLVRIAGLKPEPDLVALLICMMAARGEGSLCLSLSDEGGLEERPFLRYLSSLHPGADEKGVRAIARGIVARHGEWAPLIAASASEYKPLVKTSRAELPPLLYFQKYHQGEQALAGRIHQMIGQEFRPIDEDKIIEAFKETLAKSDPELKLDDCQKVALLTSLRMGFSIISGGPGTGKTTIVLSLVRCLLRLGTRPDRIRLTAPTGRAAQRLTESALSQLENIMGIEDPGVLESLKQISGSTIHRLLRYNPATGDFAHHAGNPIPADVIVIDEVSMVDAVLMAKLLDAVDPDTKVVFLGDKHQLPSVEAGAVLTDLVPRDREPAYTDAARGFIAKALGIRMDLKEASKGDLLADRIVLLTSSHRNQTKVAGLAAKINAGEPPDWSEFKDSAQGECRLLDDNTDDGLLHKKAIDEWIDEHFDGAYRRLASEPVDPALLSSTSGQEGDAAKARLAEILKKVDGARILCALKRGALGAIGVNGRILGRWKDEFGGKSFNGILPGAPIIVTRNDYQKDLFNGSVGVAMTGAKGGLLGVFKVVGQYVVHPIESLAGLEPAFAITIHKSQGSGYEDVLLVLPSDPDNRILTREILYTGVTRAKTNVLILGSEVVVKKAVSRKTNRESGIDLWKIEE